MQGVLKAVTGPFVRLGAGLYLRLKAGSGSACV